jgi:hypothetical protein
MLLVFKTPCRRTGRQPLRINLAQASCTISRRNTVPAVRHEEHRKDGLLRFPDRLRRPAWLEPT